MMSIFLNLLVAALSLLVVDIIFPSVSINSFVVALVAGVVLGGINLIVRPLLILLSLPVTLLTLGAFMLVVNGLCFWLASVLVPGFTAHGILTLILAPIVLALTSTLLNNYFNEKGVGLALPIPNQDEAA